MHPAVGSLRGGAGLVDALRVDVAPGRSVVDDLPALHDPPIGPSKLARVSRSRPPDERLHAGQVLAGYRLEGTAGSGGFCDVLRATRLADGAPVALKVLRAKHRGQRHRELQLLREGSLLQSLRHPRIVRCLDAGRAGPWTFLALEWLEGRALSALLERGRLRPDLALDCGFQLLEALEYLHRRGVVHQDVKPDNLLLGPRRRCTLFDFGLARTRTDALQERAGLDPLRIAGSASYRAPEQSDPHAPVGTPADIYAFAVTLHRLLTRRLPSAGAPSARLPEPLRALLARCLAEDPAARPTAAELRRSLHALERTEPKPGDDAGEAPARFGP
ncbi:MAG: serine/threonine protein kinase [Planctomycetota bacterium]|nr:MAG: serine/threonine protein kinase [Planctomycetota bacterium]